METLLYSRMKSPVGALLLGMSDSALVVLAFDPKLPDRLAGCAVRWQESQEATERACQQLEEYFAGERRKFTIPLDLRGTEFQKRCWNSVAYSFRPDSKLRTDRPGRGKSQRFPCGGAGEPLQSHRDCGPLSSCPCGRHGAGRLWRRTGNQGFPAAA